MGADLGGKPFHFVKAWLDHPGFSEEVKKSWNSSGINGWASFVFKEKLKRLKDRLRIWNKEVFGNIDKNVEDLENEILVLDRCDDVFGLEEREICRRNEASARLLIALKNRKSLLQQKARLRWLKEGDVNSSFFHKSIARRRKRNELAGLVINGDWVDDPSRVKTEVRRHFREQFQSRGRGELDVPADLVRGRLSEAQGDALISAFSEAEVKDAVWSCDSDRSPGPDGFNFGFIMAFWEVIKDDIFKVLRELHRNGEFSKGCNTSFIVLIPKKDGASELNHFWPISLIGCLYKIIAKVLANRIRPVMETVIGDCQSAFVKGRNILDGIVILNEVIEEAKKKKKKRFIFKVDFAKAYDSVEWHFLLLMMERMNFPSNWRSWILECISSASANVLINGSLTEIFHFERGIRQGDPLSPFLFLIIAEGLNALVGRAVERDLLRPVEVGRERVSIFHLQYADDTLFVVDGNLDNAKVIKEGGAAFELSWDEGWGGSADWEFGMMWWIKSVGDLKGRRLRLFPLEVG
ncbi:hypothetical protein OROHE_005502 [Orobanche hederae]